MGIGADGFGAEDDEELDFFFTFAFVDEEEPPERLLEPAPEELRPDMTMKTAECDSTLCSLCRCVKC